MLLDSDNCKANRRSHVGGLTAVAMMLVMAAGLSCLSLGPMAAQEPAAASKVTPASDPRPEPTLADQPTESQQVILLDLEMRSLDTAAWESAKSTLVDMSKRDAVAPPQLMFREVTSEQTKALTEQLDKERGAQIISRPKVMTLAGQEAVVQIGSAAPLESETVIDGKLKRHTRLVQFGHLMRFTPTIRDVDPRQMELAILVEQTDMKLKDDSPAGEKIQFPMLFSRKYELKAVVELGRTLVILEPEAHGRDGLLVRITPKLVERPVTDHSHLNPVPPLTAGVAHNGTLSAASRGRETVANDAALANQLRSVRETLESLAREREHTRAENAALKQQLEQFRLRLSELGGGKEPPAAGVPLGQPTNPVLPPDPQPKADARSLVTFSIKYHQAETLAAMLKELFETSKLDAQIQSDPRTNTLIVHADQQGLSLIKSLLTQLDTNAPTWASPGESPGGTDASTNPPSAERAQAEVKLLQLDLKAAEIDLQAAQEDLNEAQKLHESKAISDQELRMRQRAVDRAQIALARIKVQLEALSANPLQRK